MSPRVVAVGWLLLLTLAAAPLAQGSLELPAPAPPLAAYASESAGSVLVQWMPPPQPVDSFNVYGLAPGTGWRLLTTVGGQEVVAAVSADHLLYSVSAVSVGQESAAMIALDLPCVGVNLLTLPPDVVLGHCKVGGIAVKLDLP